MSITRRPVLSSELLASRVPFEEGLYVVGPFAGRVSFSSQQRRAISLVCDIDQDLFTSGLVGLDKKKVCIVGAGLAGMTCAVAAATLGARVYIFEKCPARGKKNAPKTSIDRYLSTIRDAEHRDAHPTLNFWPHEDVEPFTRLPMLNWHEDDCHNVARQITESMDRFLEDPNFRNKIAGVRNGHVVERVRRSPGNPKTWMVDVVATADADDPWREVLHYDVVIIAVGFGLEKQVANCETPSYWTPKDDIIPDLLDDLPSGFDYNVVSGTGDGGLIEALRLVFAKKRAGNIDKDTMAVLADIEVRDAVVAIERTALKMYSDHILHDSDGLQSIAARNKIADYLWFEYDQLLGNGSVADNVVESLRESRSQLKNVILLGQFNHPMELTASPYHRLLIALSIRNDWLTFKQVKDVRVAPTGTVIKVGEGRRATTVPVVDLELQLLQSAADPTGIKTEHIFNAMFLARHGYASPLYDLFALDVQGVERIRRTQYLYADQDALNPEYAKSIAQKLGLPDPSDVPAFYKAHEPAIKKYFKSRFGKTISLPEGARELYIFTTEMKASQPGAAMPPRLFGMKINNRESPAHHVFGADGYAP